MDKELIKLILKYLNRSELRGWELKEFMQIINALNKILESKDSDS